MRGRRPMPTQLKVITGNRGRKPLNKAEPRPVKGMPDITHKLSGLGQAALNEIAPGLLELGILTEIDGQGLALMAETIGDYRRARAELQAITGGSLYYETTNCYGETVVKLHPAAKVLRDADRQIKAWLGEFGSTPLARTRIG
jgi:phage terminase small subunit